MLKQGITGSGRLCKRRWGERLQHHVLHDDLMHLCILHQHHLHHIWEEVIQRKKVRALLATDKQKRYLSRSCPPGCELMNTTEMKWLKRHLSNISITCPDGAKLMSMNKTIHTRFPVPPPFTSKLLLSIFC